MGSEMCIRDSVKVADAVVVVVLLEIIVACVAFDGRIGVVLVSWLGQSESLGLEQILSLETD